MNRKQLKLPMGGDKPRSTSKLRYKRPYRIQRLLCWNVEEPEVYELYYRGEFIGVSHDIRQLRDRARSVWNNR